MISRDEFDRTLEAYADAAAPAVSAASALGLVREGIVVSAGAEPPPAPATDGYRLEQWHDAGDRWQATNDRITLPVHGAHAMTHIDALSHFDAAGADVVSLRDGIVGRGTLIDIAGHLGRSVAPGEAVDADVIRATLAAQGGDPQPGDALWIRLLERGHRPSALDSLPGVSIACAGMIADWRPSVVVTDAGMDPAPSEVEGLPVPWHVFLLTVLKVPLVDLADLTDLARTASRLGRWEFFSVIAPLALTGASGSPVNPLAVF
jgi:kynurenine formamidase